MRAIQALVALFVVLVICADLCRGQSIDSFIKSKAIRSTVLLEVEFRDGFGKPIALVQRITGHGVWVSERQVLLTAAHVLFPSVDGFTKNGASTYVVRITTWNPSTRAFEDYPEIDAESLAVALPPLSELVACRKEAIQIRCLKNDPPVDRDFVFLNAGVSSGATREPVFSDVLGPLDDSEFLSAPTYFVSADFAADGEVTIANVERNDVKSFSTDTNKEFKRGISGSPVFAAIDQPRDSLVVVGVVLTAAAEPKWKFSILRTEDIFSNWPSEQFHAVLQTWVSDERLWNCDLVPLPYPAAVLGNFVASERLSYGERSRLLECLSELGGWKLTARVAATTDRNQRVVESVTGQVDKIAINKATQQIIKNIEVEGEQTAQTIVPDDAAVDKRKAVASRAKKEAARDVQIKAANKELSRALSRAIKGRVF